MEDSIGNKLNVGDKVAIQLPSRNKLGTGIVNKLTPTGAVVARRTGVGSTTLFRQANQMVLMPSKNQAASDAFTAIVNFLADNEVEELKEFIEVVHQQLN